MKTRHRRWFALALGLAACGSDIPHPREATLPQPAWAFVEVDFPPPPARPEFVPAQPAKGSRWVNGEWQWTGSRWAWKQGVWVLPPENAAFAKPSFKRSADGKLLHAPGTWRNDRGEEVRLGDADRSKAASASLGGGAERAGEDVSEGVVSADVGGVQAGSPQAGTDRHPMNGRHAMDAGRVEAGYD